MCAVISSFFQAIPKVETILRFYGKLFCLFVLFVVVLIFQDLFILSGFILKSPLKNMATKIAWLNFTFGHFLIFKNYKCYFGEETFHLIDAYIFQIRESMFIIIQWHDLPSLVH